MQPVADPDNQVKNEIHEGTAVDGNNHGFWPWDGGVGIAGPLMTLPGGQAVPADLRFYSPIAVVSLSRRIWPIPASAGTVGRAGAWVGGQSAGCSWPQPASRLSIVAVEAGVVAVQPVAAAGDVGLAPQPVAGAGVVVGAIGGERHADDEAAAEVAMPVDMR